MLAREGGGARGPRAERKRARPARAAARPPVGERAASLPASGLGARVPRRLSSPREGAARRRPRGNKPSRKRNSGCGQKSSISYRSSISAFGLFSRIATVVTSIAIASGRHCVVAVASSSFSLSSPSRYRVVPGCWMSPLAPLRRAPEEQARARCTNTSHCGLNCDGHAKGVLRLVSVGEIQTLTPATNACVRIARICSPFREFVPRAGSMRVRATRRQARPRDLVHSFAQLRARGVAQAFEPCGARDGNGALWPAR